MDYSKLIVDTANAMLTTYVIVVDNANNVMIQ